MRELFKIGNHSKEHCTLLRKRSALQMMDFFRTSVLHNLQAAAYTPLISEEDYRSE
jgi:hypothetical protein